MGKLQVEASTIDPTGRKCSGECKEFKAWNKFNKKDTGINGHESACNACSKKRARVRAKYPGVKAPRVSNLITDVDYWWDGIRVQDVCMGRVL